VHSPFGAPVHAPWALCIGARMRERFGVEVQAMAADDGIVLRLPDVEFDDGADAGADDSVDADLPRLRGGRGRS
jgi:ATP-dependent Lhr-like helicase